MGEVHLRLTDGTTFTAALSDGMTVEELKAAISGADKANCEPDRMKLVYKGKILKDDQTLESYGAWERGMRAACSGRNGRGPRERAVARGGRRAAGDER